MIQPIDRLDDPRVSSFARVGDPAWLRDHDLFVTEGRLVVRRLLALERYVIESILVTHAALESLQDVLPDAVPVYVVDQGLLDSVTGFNFHRGCLALARRSVVSSITGNRLVALEGIGNPDNVGGIFRNAAAFGVNGVLLDPTSGDPLYRKAIRTSMGAALVVPFERLERWPQDLERLKANGFSILALTPRRDARLLEDIAQQPPARWVLLAGGEGAGLSEAALRVADTTARIPMTEGVDSLNVTVAVGIALSRLF